jgi:hypothetical protein
MLQEECREGKEDVMKLLRRASISSHAHGIDVTVRQNLIVSPDWDHVMNWKENTKQGIHFHDCTCKACQTYRVWYLDKLDRHYGEVKAWVDSLDGDTITFLCYCKNHHFCHTYLLIDWLVTNFPGDYLPCKTKYQKGGKS